MITALISILIFVLIAEPVTFAFMFDNRKFLLLYIPIAIYLSAAGFAVLFGGAYGC